jgi:hypothetical protein
MHWTRGAQTPGAMAADICGTEMCDYFCHSADAYNFEVASGFLENMGTQP